MNILWAGGEDVDFPNGLAASFDTTSATHRTTYARGGFYTTANGWMKGTQFPGGAVTSAWLCCYLYSGPGQYNGQIFMGFGKVGTAGAVYLSTHPSNSGKFCIQASNGSSSSVLASEPGASFSVGPIYRFDIQMVSWGTSATVNVFINGALQITFSGDVSTPTGQSNFDSVFCYGQNTANQRGYFSEIVVADSDTRGIVALQTLALTGAGTTDNWTGTYSGINGTTINDANPNYTNTATQDQQFNITDLPAGTWNIAAVKISARMAVGAGSAVSNVSLGYNDGGSVNFGTGASKTLTTAYTTYEQIDQTNPVTGVGFVQSEMNALQLDLRSS